MTAPTDLDPYAEIRALRERLRRLEEMDQAAAKPPELSDKTPDFSAAIRQLRATGSASGSAVDALRRQITGSLELTPDSPADQPSPDPIAAAYRRMQETAERRNTVESLQAGASGHVDVLDPRTASAIDKVRRALEERP
jgi:hypothetical protein